MNGHFIFFIIMVVLFICTIGIARLIDIFESGQDWYNDKKKEESEGGKEA